MKVEINNIAKHFAHLPFEVEGIYRFTQRPGKFWPSHTESFPGFVFPLRGNLEFAFDGATYVFTPGKVIHGGAKMKLDEKKSSDEPWEYLLVHYRICTDDLKEWKLSSSHFELQVGYSLRLYDMLERLWKISFQSGGIIELQMKMLFYNILEEVFICGRNQDKSSSRELFEQASTYIHDHYNESLAISILSEQNGVSRNRLAYVFNKYLGMGPGDYLISYRLNRAKEILLVQNISIQELALTVGFNDPFYFSKAFKKQFGLSPSQYRNKLINNPC